MSEETPIDMIYVYRPAQQETYERQGVKKDMEFRKTSRADIQPSLVSNRSWFHCRGKFPSPRNTERWNRKVQQVESKVVQRKWFRELGTISLRQLDMIDMEICPGDLSYARIVSIRDRLWTIIHQKSNHSAAEDSML
jgi:hypothetical protein